MIQIPDTHAIVALHKERVQKMEEGDRRREAIVPLTDRLHTEQVKAKHCDLTQAGPFTNSLQCLHRMAKPVEK